jgi:hypothetical protein
VEDAHRQPQKPFPGHYRLALGILDPATEKPAIPFGNDLPRRAGWALTSEVDIEE